MKQVRQLLFLSLLAFPVALQAQAEAEQPTEIPPGAIASEVLLIINQQEITLPLTKESGLLKVIPRQYWVLGQQEIPLETDQVTTDAMVGRVVTAWEPVIDPVAVRTYLSQQGVHLSGGEKSAVTITEQSDGAIEFDGFPSQHLEVDMTGLAQLLQQTAGYAEPVVRIDAPVVYSDVAVTDGLKERGIVEVLGIGHSDFVGSTPTRIQNIKAAAERMQGTIIEKGESFSFNTVLDDVSEEYGFVEEKVINGGRIRYEMGGGICQVSTTVYRAALDAAVEIRNRRSHTWVVPYYGQPGLDATIYLGSQDLEFYNDTPGDVLMQYHIDGTELRFILYGTADGRSTKLEGPIISNNRKIPSPIYEFSSTVAPGGEVWKEGGIKGFDAVWNYTIIRPDGTEEAEEIISKYSAKAPLVLYGPKVKKVAPEPTPEVAPATVPTKPVQVQPVAAPIAYPGAYCSAGGC